MRHQESELQRACVAWFKMSHPELSSLLYAIGNGGARSKVEAAIMKGEGVLAGVADLCLDVASGGYHGMKIEMKRWVVTYGDHGKERRRQSRQSPAQKAWQKAVEAQGYLYVICRDFEEFRSHIDAYLGARMEQQKTGDRINSRP